MKLIIIISSVLLLCSSIVSGQTFAFAGYPVTDYTHFNDSGYVPHRKHSITTRIGEGILIGGGVLTVVGAGSALLTKDNGSLTGALFIVSGQLLAGIGGIVFGCGRIYEKTHKAKFGIVSKGKRIGLAYNLD